MFVIFKLGGIKNISFGQFSYPATFCELIEVDIKPEHADLEETAATMEPITEATVDKMTGAPPKVEVTKAKKPSS